MENARIDSATIEKIKDATNIVEVVSEFVSLRKRGINYVGLCPFHNEKTPSFYVSPTRGFFNCFGCGKGGTAITFIMEHEQMTYPEALRWLANKYHIEIQERELTDEERREQSERESMFIINEWAAKYFEQQLQTEGEGTTYGLPYFRSRGFRDDIIAKFRLGYDLQSRFALPDAAKVQGYQPEYLLKTGICYQNDRGELIDRYAGRVVFPWIGLSGKVVGFTARVLDSRTKGVNMKYVNSPDSDIYHKAHELYGIYQAKKAIVKNDRVYLVEGQADVISMHQAGIENVVAGSGTALSFPQIHMLHRLTSNITLIYDDDAAGLHAALKGTDMLLSEGMNLKVLLLPDGDDPDSFARKHTADELRQYIDANETDFIQFKTELLLKNETDPVKRTAAINSIIKSISLVTNTILRDTYVQTCVQRIGVAESTLINTMNNFIREAKESKNTEARRGEEAPPMVTETATQPSIGQPVSAQEKVERLLAQMIIRKGARRVFRQVETEDGGTVDLTVAQYIYYDLQADSLQFSNPLYRRILDEAVAHADDPDFDSENYFIHHENIEIGRVAADLCVDRLQLTRNDEPAPQDAYIDDRERQKEEEEQLRNQTLHLVLDFRMDYVERRLKALSTEIAAATSEPARMNELIKEYTQLQTVRNNYARRLGTNIVV